MWKERETRNHESLNLGYSYICIMHNAIFKTICKRSRVTCYGLRVTSYGLRSKKIKRIRLKYTILNMYNNPIF